MQNKAIGKVVVTGSQGFIGKNLLVHLKQIPEIIIETITREDTIESCNEKLQDAAIIFHLAGVNRTSREEDFYDVNSDFTANLLQIMEQQATFYKFVYVSSAQVTLDNPYGKSKLLAENTIKDNVKNGMAFIYRLPGVFGKWCRPNYNSVVATFCHNIASGLPLSINNENQAIELIYIDDVVHLLLQGIANKPEKGQTLVMPLDPIYKITVGELAKKIESFKESRNNYFLPLVGEELEKKLYSTYLTYLPENDFAYQPIKRSDERGSLFELVKSFGAGQFFISYTKPGITRGNHFHHTKTEKFCVIAGKAILRFRKIDGNDVLTYEVSGETPSIVDIPPGYTHNITNVGDNELVTLFWANEIFNPQLPDTYFEQV